LALPVTDLDAAVSLIRGLGMEAIPGSARFEVRDPYVRIPYDLAGSIALLRDGGPDEAETVMARHPSVRTVYLTRGIEGGFRTPDLVLLSGPDDPVTIVREDGFEIEVDVRNTYFSPRLAHERGRVVSLARPGETVVDMFCGVGPFSLHLARRGCRVHAVDLNPIAVDLARRNAARNGLSDRIEVHHGDAREVVPRLAAGGLRADRIVMNHPTAALGFLDSALAAIARGTIHLYLMVERDGLDAAIGRVRGRLAGRNAGIRPHQVRSVSPAGDQWCLDIDVRM
ncbi:MAG TPA: methyltransferase domain-containing protein, partial [Thermoplasmata archaeon]|nr:methyltransferase domain-containing protein [Thermoplasmata archaeon]